MKRSVPLYRLKRQAKLLSRREDIPLHQALDRVAESEGFSSWSLLAAKAPATRLADGVFPWLAPGDLVLLGARPGQGKTLMSLELAVAAMKAGRRAFFFTLEDSERQMRERFRKIGADWAEFEHLFECDVSEAISAGYIEERLAAAAQGTFVVVDYLQLLDQKRDNPDLATQVGALRRLAQRQGLIMVLLSQIDRSYDAAAKAVPDMEDVRLPNPFDLTLFSKSCFLNDRKIRCSEAA
jgi:replicative DNA helicase